MKLDYTKIKRFKDNNRLKWTEFAHIAGISERYLKDVAWGAKKLSERMNDKLERIGCFDGDETQILDNRKLNRVKRPRARGETPMQFALCEYMMITGKSQSDISRESGVNNSIVSYIVSRGTYPSIDSFAKLCVSCELDANVLIKQIVADEGENKGKWR